MNIFSRISSILFSKIITIKVDFINEKFILSLFKNEKIYSIDDNVNDNMLNTYLIGSKKINDNSAEITLYAAEMLYGNIKQSTKEIIYSLSQRAERIRFKYLNDEVKFKIFFDELTGNMICKLPKDAKWIGEEHILFNNTILRVPSSQIKKLLHRSNSGGENILNAIKYLDKPYIDSNIKIDDKSILTISCETNNDESLAIIYKLKYPEKSWINISGLKYYAVSNNIVFKIPEILMNDKWKKMFNNEVVRCVHKEHIPEFVEEFWDIINEYGDKDIKDKLSPANFFWQLEDISLELQCIVENTNTVGKAYGVPVCRFGEELVSAKELSLNIGNKNSFVSGKYLSSSCLQQIGIGVMGRMIDGTSLNPIELKANEIIYRGSERLEGLWKRFNLKNDYWKSTGSPEEITKSHLNYLKTFGINGGIVLPESEKINLIKQCLNEYDDQNYYNTKKLILLRKKMLNELDIDKLQNLFTILKGVKSDPILSNQNNRNVICTYTILEKHENITLVDWDIILMIEPDEQFKTSSSVIYQNVRKIKGSIKLGIFSESPKSYSVQKFLAISNLFELSMNDNFNSCIYQIRQVDKPLELPKEYEFKSKKPVKITEAVEIRIDGEDENSYSIPNKTSNEITVNGISFKIEMSYGSTDSGSNFKGEATKYMNKVESQCSFVPFMSYWPTYSSMNNEQKKWYFYWRKKVREGTYLDTDLSYIFLYVYELLNGVGYKQPSEGYELIWNIWQAYDKEFPKLSSYLSNWIFDFVIINKLDDKLEKLLISAAVNNNHILFSFYILKKYVEKSSEILLEDVLKIINYSIDKSKVSLKGEENLLREELDRVINIVNKETINKYGKNLFVLFCPMYKTEEHRYAYSSAVYDGNISYNVSYLPFKQHFPLVQFLTSLVKEIENRIRKKINFSGRLKVTELDEFFIEIIDREYTKVNEKKIESVDKVKTDYTRAEPLKVDVDLINQLRKESTEIQEILTTEDEFDENNEKDLYINDSKEEFIENNQPIVINNESNDEMQELIAELPKYKIEVLTLLLSGINVEDQLQKIAIANGTMAEIMLDEINEEFENKINDILIDTNSMPHCILEEYVEDLKNSIERMKNNE